jgi:tRNA dimethylallyltransferase
VSDAVAVVRVAIVGPTASGKSAVAMAAAEQLGDVDLISIDSMQVYRRMDIGTAKPTPGERRRVTQHLLDLVEPDADFTVAEFQLAYRSALSAIADGGHRAILVGGTGLYHRAVVDDLVLPGEWPDVRARLLAELTDAGPAALHARLAAIDPVAASRMEPTNERRIVRALEVCEGSGRPFSSFGPGLDAYPPTEVVQIGLAWDRVRLSERITTRVHAMVAAGLVDEVAAIDSAPGFSRTAAQALGYKEILDHLRGVCSLDEAVDRIIARTRQFAIRQIRWFRRDPRVQWVEVGDDPVDVALPIVVDALGAGSTRGG